MRRLTKSGSLAIVTLFLLFFPLLFALPRLYLFQLLNGLCVSTCIGIVIAYWKGMWGILKMPYRLWGSGDALIAGVFVFAVGVIGTFAGIWEYRATGNTAYSTSATAAFARWIIVMGTTILLLVAGSDDGRIPPRSYRYAGMMVAIGCAIAIGLVSAGIS